ncbi:Hypothetical predicted protein [Mytilus galloprovincialis]|uniref:Uncharacterized protein n=1 Tax=Mytilus galloprovincialis TaxID=29158 RepID=A0A8B6BR92_MYTGA|nr:Hypothetical predicted protein [Mytilus galloprovincialis]
MTIRTTTTTTARTTTTTIAWTTTQPALELGLLAWAIVATIMLVFIVVTASIVCYCRNRRKQYQQVPGRGISLSGVELYTLTPSPVTHSVPDPLTPESLDDTPPIIQVSSPIARRTRSKKILHFEEEV